MRKAGGGAIVNICSTGAMKSEFGGRAVRGQQVGRARDDQDGGAGTRARQHSRQLDYPRAIRTPMTAGPAVAAFAATAGPDGAAFVESLIRDLAIPRMGEPEDITRLVLFVASDEASFFDRLRVHRRWRPPARPGAAA